MEPFNLLGNNTDGPDLPLGLGMGLAQSPRAMEAFGRMSKEQRAALISHIQGAATGDDAKNRIAEAIQQLGEGQMQF